MSDVDELAAQAGARCQGYWLLSRLFLEPPAAAFLNEVQASLAAARSDSPALQADIAFLRAAVSDALQDSEAAAVAFTRYLVVVPKGSGETLPFESQFVRGRARESLNEDLHQKIAAWGYGAALALAAPPDHLGAELRLMAWLCNDEREAWQRGDPAAAMESLCRQMDLLSGHIVQWIPDYCRELCERAANTYLQGIARIATTTLGAEVELLNRVCSQVDIRSLC